MLKNDFADRAIKAESEGWDESKLKELLGASARGLVFLKAIKLKVSLKQVKVRIGDEILTVKEVFNKLLNEISEAKQRNERIIF